jgi:hypothetical protein
MFIDTGKDSVGAPVERNLFAKYVVEGIFCVGDFAQSRQSAEFAQ